MTVVRNPGYWDAPRPYIDQINFRVVTNESQRMNSFLAGEAQLMYTTQGDTAQAVRKSGVNEASVILNGASVIIFNTTRAPFNDVRARRAVILNLDAVKFQKEVGNNGKDPVKTLFTPGSPFDDGTPINPYDPAESQRLLDQLAAEKGAPLTFTFLAFNTSFSTATSEWFQAQFQNMRNVKVNIEKIASSAGQARVLAKNYDASPWGFGFSDPEPTLASSFMSNGGPTNATGFSDSTLDAALLKGRNTFDVNERIAAYKTVTRILAEQSPAWWDDRSSFYNLGSKQLQDMRVYEDGIMRWDVIWFQK
jgi:peptide/nickel transport system substrate-binding protein